jgi:hypothetical protein
METHENKHNNKARRLTGLPYTWSEVLGVFTKTCTKCKTLYKGGTDIETSRNIFSVHFFSRANSRDGFNNTCKGCRVEWHYYHRFGLRIHDVQRRLENQGGKCAICSKEISLVYDPYGGQRSAHVDHNHTTGKVRGLLCVSCNMKMSGVDDKVWLRKAFAYTDKYK